MAEENKKLSEAVAAGHGAKHNIEVEEAAEQSDQDDDDAMTGSGDKQQKDGKAPVIEMVRAACTAACTAAFVEWPGECGR
ncbi:unnamed protein product [Phytophthora fragariaefolia]|uniref:Unnamed protein product n=1 Tax=Phytophthora fragariaefolia TaxID=1490495 RepID=A0A9W6XJ57_9STRA|nr:unnamed protein product [Phytophthora fragariaefolia]